MLRFRLRELLEERGVGQSELSRQSGVSYAVINRLCTNVTKQVALHTLDRLCAALRCEPGELFSREPDPGLTGMRDALRGR